MFHAKRSRPLKKPVHSRAVEVARASQTVRAREARKQFEVDLLCEPPKRPVANLRGFIEHPRLQVMRYESDDLILTSKYIDLNVLSVDPEKVIVNALFPELIKTLEKHGFTPIPIASPWVSAGSARTTPSAGPSRAAPTSEGKSLTLWLMT